MSSAHVMSKAAVVTAVALFVVGCEDEKPAPEKAAPSAKVAQPVASAPAPKPVASAAPAEPHHDCPDGSTGEGSFNKPCEGKGTSSLMTVTWTGKMDDKGPSFRVVNTSKLDILYGKVVVYFYDKAGKQLEAQDTSETPPKGKPKQTCAGNIFDGPMKAGEKAVITFSCVKKDNVPDGATAMEAEMEMVGFTDSDGKKNEFYWRNKDLTPDERAKSKAKKK
jgi:hypothetical protein